MRGPTWFDGGNLWDDYDTPTSEGGAADLGASLIYFNILTSIIRAVLAKVMRLQLGVRLQLDIIDI